MRPPQSCPACPGWDKPPKGFTLGELLYGQVSGCMDRSVPQIILAWSLGFQSLWLVAPGSSLPHVTHKYIPNPPGVCSTLSPLALNSSQTMNVQWGWLVLEIRRDRGHWSQVVPRSLWQSARRVGLNVLVVCMALF